MKKSKFSVTFPKEEKISKQSPKDETSHFCLPFLQAPKKKHGWQTAGRDVAASLLKETKYNQFLSSYLKKTITSNPLTLMTYTDVPKMKCKHKNNEVSHIQTALSQAGTVLKVWILDLKLQRHQEAKALSGNKILVSLSIDWQLWP